MAMLSQVLCKDSRKLSRAYGMLFTANQHFKADSRTIARADGMYCYTDRGDVT